MNKALQPAMQASGIQSDAVKHIEWNAACKGAKVNIIVSMCATEPMAAAHAGCELIAQPLLRVSELHAGQMQALLMLIKSDSKTHFFQGNNDGSEQEVC